MMMTGERVGADEALAVGLLDRLLPEEDFEGEGGRIRRAPSPPGPRRP